MAPTDHQRIADLVAAQFLLLWPLDPSDRMKLINEIAADYQYDLELRLVSECMGPA